MGFEESIVETWNAVRSLFSGVLSNIIIAIVILLVGFIIGRVVGRVSNKFFHEIELDNVVRKAAKIKFSVEELLSKFIAYFIYFITVIMALNQLGLTTTILYMISAAIIILIILSIFLGVKDFIPNLIAGIFIHEKRNINVGDVIKFRDIEGEIIHINLIETKIRTKRGDMLFIPNSNLTKNEFIKVKKRKGKKA